MTGKQKSLSAKAKKIKLVILDVDGVLTDGGIILDNRGNEHKRFHVRDGHGIKMLQREGCYVALVTGRSSKVVVQRAGELGITDVYQKCLNKLDAYNRLIKKYSLSDNEIAYIGDDIVDIPIMTKVGLPIAVSDADEEIKKYALMITNNGGGRGAVREVTDFILKAKGLWQVILDGYLKT